MWSAMICVMWSVTNKRCENVWFQASQKPSLQDLETEWFRNVAKLQFWLAGACWILDPVATLPFLMWHHQLGSRTGRAVTWCVANQMYYIKAPITRNGDWVLERFRHVAMRVCGVQQRFLLRRDPSDRIGVCDLSARIGGGSLWTRRNLISLDPLMLLGNSVLFSCELNPFDSISTLAVWSSKPFFAIR